jgi:hypothetical protein
MQSLEEGAILADPGPSASKLFEVQCDGSSTHEMQLYTKRASTEYQRTGHPWLKASRFQVASYIKT